MTVSLAAILSAWAIIIASALVPYPTGAVQYWLKGSLLLVGGAFLLAAAPFRVMRELPERGILVLLRPSPRVFVAAVVIITIALSAMFGWYLFAHSGTTSDEMAQLWHAKMLVHGRLSLPADPNPEFFALDNIISTPKWYSQYPIGGPAVLALGVLIGAPWLVNPILAGIAAAMMYFFGRRAYGEAQGRAIALLFSVTPMVLMMSGSYMNHVPVLCLATCALAAVAEWDAAESSRRGTTFAALTGMAIGAMATIRPLDAAVVAIVIGAFQFTVVRRNRARGKELAVQAIAGAIAVAPLFIANWATTGGPFTFGYETLWGAGHQLGFHTDPHGNVHTLGQALYFAVTYVAELNLFAMLWPVPAMIVACLGLIAMQRFSRWDALLLALFWAQVIAYGAYWYQGQFLGPRFMFTALPAVVVLLARTPFLVGERFSGLPRRAALVFTLACVVVSWTVPGTRFGVLGMASDVRHSRGVFKVNMEDAAGAADLHHALVVLREPFGSQLEHRLWGVGMSRSETAQLLAKSDACSLFESLRTIERDASIPANRKADSIASATLPFVPGMLSVRLADPTLHVSSDATLTPACRAEIELDGKLGVATFGSVLPLEPIDSEGRVNGDVIYVMDLGERNELLKGRFGDRTWYRLSVIRPGSAPRPTLAPY